MTLWWIKMNEETVNAFSVLILIIVPLATGIIAFFQKKQKYWPVKTARDLWKCVGIPLLIAGAAAIIMFFLYTLLLFVLFENSGGAI
jgi:ABC-type sulfate transport system permease component